MIFLGFERSGASFFIFAFDPARTVTFPADPVVATRNWFDSQEKGSVSEEQGLELAGFRCSCIQVDGADREV